MKKLFLALMAVAAIALTGCKDKNEEPNLTTTPEWFETATPINPNYVDVIYFAGTELDYEYDKEGNELTNITLTAAQKAKIGREYQEAFELLCPDSVNFFAPYYHQATMHAETTTSTVPAALSTARKDVLEIFRYYMEHINNGRPFILGGFSQGAMMVNFIINSLSDEEYSRMKAAYMIGFGLQDAIHGKHVIPATGEFDKGVTISFNSVATNDDIWTGTYAGTPYCINPVNWKTDNTPAEFTYDGMKLTNHIDTTTYVIHVEGFDFVTHPSILPGCTPHWTEHNLHVHEVRMYAPYLRKNIKDRAYR